MLKTYKSLGFATLLCLVLVMVGWDLVIPPEHVYIGTVIEFATEHACTAACDAPVTVPNGWEYEYRGVFHDAVERISGDIDANGCEAVCE